MCLIGYPINHVKPRILDNFLWIINHTTNNFVNPGHRLLEVNQTGIDPKNFHITIRGNLSIVQFDNSYSSHRIIKSF